MHFTIDTVLATIGIIVAVAAALCWCKIRKWRRQRQMHKEIQRNQYNPDIMRQMR